MKSLTSLKLIILTLLLISCASKESKVSAQNMKVPAEVVLTEYSDYQCPACAYFNPIVNSLKEEFGERLFVEYRFFPLNSHQFGALSARAAQAAKNQGKFMEMHNLLFEHQRQWSSGGSAQPVFINYARKLGLNVDQFKRDLNAAETQRAVMEDKQEGINAGVNSTPTFFINGEKLEQNPRTFEEFKSVIEGYLEEAD